MHDHVIAVTYKAIVWKRSILQALHGLSRCRYRCYPPHAFSCLEDCHHRDVIAAITASLKGSSFTTLILRKRNWSYIKQKDMLRLLAKNGVSLIIYLFERSSLEVTLRLRTSPSWSKPIKSLPWENIPEQHSTEKRQNLSSKRTEQVKLTAHPFAASA